MSAPVVVLKFGSSVLRGLADLPEAVNEVYRHYRAGARVVVVASALGSTTDELLEKARALAADSEHAEPEPEALAALLATGERAAVEYLTLALQAAGLPARSLPPERAGLCVAGTTLDAAPVAVDSVALKRELARHSILVLPGFVGLDQEGRLALLGRGGSDLSALAFAAALGAERCLLLKDVDGLYERDPALPGPPPRRFGALPFARALALEEGVVQHKAIRYAALCGTSFEVGGVGHDETTRIGPAAARFAARPAPRPLRVALAGLGVVGGGVLTELRRARARFELVGVASRSMERLAPWPEARLLWTGEPLELLERSPDVFVELTGAHEAEAWIRCALARGIHVVSAHKELLARRGVELGVLANASRVTLACSAAVGGALPALECVQRLATRGPLARIEGVLNATTNYLLTLAEDGLSLSEALARARARGLVEREPARDLDGHDALAKLVLLVRAGFGVDLDPESLPRARLDEGLFAAARRAHAGGACLRLVARAHTLGTRVTAELIAVRLPARHALAARGLENRLCVTHIDGTSESLRAAGAGRGPTTVSVLADLLDLWRAQRPAQSAARRVRA
ncbi:MAG: hypothetical protein EXS08_04095 [Planctomycetes bacterium]|nr:hypothetical protein [Planctomycetota bacterium]